MSFTLSQFEGSTSPESTLEVKDPSEVAQLAVSTTPVRGQIYLNDVLQGLSPQAFILDPGPYFVSFGDVDGYRTPLEEVLVLRGGDVKSVLGTYTSLFLETYAGALAGAAVAGLLGYAVTRRALDTVVVAGLGGAAGYTLQKLVQSLLEGKGKDTT